MSTLPRSRRNSLPSAAAQRAFDALRHLFAPSTRLAMGESGALSRPVIGAIEVSRGLEFIARKHEEGGSRMARFEGGAERVREATLATRPPSSPPPSGADYNLKIVWTLARYVEQHYGAEGLRQVAEAGGVKPSDFDLTNRWVGWQAFEDLIAKARSLMKSDEEFKRACVHRLREGYGPLRYILWAATPGLVLSQACKHSALVCTTGELTWTDHGRTGGHFRYKSRVPFSRVCCLIRHAQAEALPTMWGLPPAHLREEACIGLGDATCELDVHWYEVRRWLPVALGGVSFALVGAALARFGLRAVPAPVVMAIIGALLGYLFEGRRTGRINERTREEVMKAFQQVAHGEAAARRELLEMHVRQKDWTRVVEEEMRARSMAFQKIAHGVTELHEARATAVLGVSHDLRNPLQIINMASEYLRSLPSVMTDDDAAEVVHDIDHSVVRMRKMLGELVLMTKAQRDFITMDPQPVETQALTESVRGRLRALMHGREIRTPVFSTREAPPVIEVDPLALDRIIDNLLTNAAKYTERGSVVVELDGTPGFLVIKVSDTGCGIEADALERVFHAGGSDAEGRRGDSFGVGLSVVVELLDQIGGRLEVMSRPGAGTTFWVYLPVKSEPRSRVSQLNLLATVGGENEEQSMPTPLRRVVKIRKVPA